MKLILNTLAISLVGMSNLYAHVPQEVDLNFLLAEAPHTKKRQKGDSYVLQMVKLSNGNICYTGNSNQLTCMELESEKKLLWQKSFITPTTKKEVLLGLRSDSREYIYMFGWRKDQQHDEGKLYYFVRIVDSSGEEVKTIKTEMSSIKEVLVGKESFFVIGSDKGDERQLFSMDRDTDVVVAKYSLNGESRLWAKYIGTDENDGFLSAKLMADQIVIYGTIFNPTQTKIKPFAENQNKRADLREINALARANGFRRVMRRTRNERSEAWQDSERELFKIVVDTKNGNGQIKRLETRLHHFRLFGDSFISSGGNLVVSGTKSNPTGPDRSINITAMDKTGRLLWDNTISFGLKSEYQPRPYKLLETASGDIIFVGDQIIIEGHLKLLPGLGGMLSLRDGQLKKTWMFGSPSDRFKVNSIVEPRPGEFLFMGLFNTHPDLRDPNVLYTHEFLAPFKP